MSGVFIPPGTLHFRPEKPDDCRTIASLYSISSDGVADYLWTTLAEPGENILDVGCPRYQRGNTGVSYRNCILAEFDSQIRGMMVAFLLYVDPSGPGLKPYSEQGEDHRYYLCGVALPLNTAVKVLALSL